MAEKRWDPLEAALRRGYICAMAETAFATLPFKEWGLGLDRPLLIAGPCSAESRDQVLATADGIRRHAPQVQVYRAGAWKPRTRPGGFEGVGAAALPWLREVKERTGLLTLTEVATPGHVEEALRHGIDMLWIGARTTPNPFSVQAIADALRGVDIPVLVKNPVSPDLQLWTGALERIASAGIRRMAAVHRGFNWSNGGNYRNDPMWGIPIRLKGAFPGLDLICDPSHITGRPDLLAEVAQQALDLNFSGLMLECHRDPAHAWSDPGQQVVPEHLGRILSGLTMREPKAEAHQCPELTEMRNEIREIDAHIMRLLGQRMEVAARIGRFKQAHNMAILQPEWWRKVMEAQLDAGLARGLSEGFIRACMDTVHDESIRRQGRTWQGLEWPEDGPGMPAQLAEGEDPLERA